MCSRGPLGVCFEELDCLSPRRLKLGSARGPYRRLGAVDRGEKVRLSSGAQDQKTVTPTNAPGHVCRLQMELCFSWAQAEGQQVDLLNDESLQEQRKASQ